MTMKLYRTKITDANGGMHSLPNYRKAEQMLVNHPYINARLYHLVLTGSEDRKDYRWALDSLCKKLRRMNMPCQWKACYEVDEQKRFHMHVFLLVEAAYRVPCQVIRYRQDGWLTSLLEQRGLGFHISQPQNALHHQNGKPGNYAYVPRKAGDKLHDCCEWISYLFKVRSKEGVVGQIYTSSTNRGSAKARSAAPAEPQQPQAECLEQPAPTTNNNQKADDDMNLTNLTPAGLQYMAGLYEHCVDADMDVGAIYAYLTRKGVSVTRAEVIHHLDHVFKFDGYAATHPAKPIITYAQADAEMRKPARKIEAAGSNVGRTDLPLKPTETGVQKILDKNYEPVHN